MKFTTRLFSFGVSLVLILSLVASLTLTRPQTAHAATLPAYRYTKTFDTSGGSARGNSVATDAQGNIYVAGNYSGTVIFDGAGGSDSRTPGGGNSGSFLTKYNANGSYAYTKTFDTSAGSAVAHGQGVATDAQGNIYDTGQFNGTVVFDGTGGSDSQTVSNTSSFLTKYNANGSYAYTKIFDTSAGSAQAFGQGVATDAQGNIYETGQFQGTVVFDGTGGSDSQTDAGGNGDSYLTKYNANGTYAYTKTFDTSVGGSTYADSFGVTADPQGNVYVTGDYGGTVTFDGTGGSDSHTAGGLNDGFFLTKYNANGTYGYTKTFDTSAGSAYADGEAVATDSQGNIYIEGDFQYTVVFDGPGGSDSQTSSNGSDFLTKYNANGTYAYTKTFDTSAGSAIATGTGVAIDTQDNIYITGYFGGTVTFDGTGGSDSQTAGGSSSDSFLTKYNSDGDYGYTKIFDISASGAQAFGNSIATDLQGNVYTAGRFTGTVVFDGIGGSDSQTSSNQSSFLTSFQVFTPSPTSPAATPASAPVPGAPNTGFGVFMTSPLRTVAIYSLFSIGLAGLAAASRRVVKEPPK